MIYFDNSATTKPKKEVLDTFYKVAENYFGNPSSVHHLGLQAENLLSQARNQIATLLKTDEQEIIFTSGGTEGNNFIIKGVAEKYRNRGHHMITTMIEHPSVLNTCIQLENSGFDVTYLPVDETGRVRVEDVKKALRKDTILVSIMHVNNEIGSVQPIEKIGELLKNHPKTLFHVDHVQGVTKVPLDFHESNVDFASISSHKFHGLKGTGAIYIRKGLKLAPLLAGGGQERGFRSGTENLAGIVAMAKALRLGMLDYEAKIDTMMGVRDFLINELQLIEGVKMNTPKQNTAPHIINFSVQGFKAEVLVHELEQHGLYVSTTSACSSRTNEPSRTILAMGLGEERATTSIRISLSFDNTKEEAKQAVAIIKQSIKNLKPIMRG
ncbi:cysteine desulfurase [Caldibacillus sp. 210928-DFI.2.22]|uniref:cysteine desulfurase family protein n=1 Tax=unclassified Caldibacillus TaxID=2641266 RepID=UPI001D0613FF|nr:MULTISPECIES: cysteine desulfurase family protein [unclassified Caldibacillus]MCB7069279.1 cysteine desulfurase [Caldibacillus sp. 210928-DFI.2.22]MCB7072684.1 cysteine desulfurase [Caldibacillus sp. 210928-DFI.2.18]